MPNDYDYDWAPEEDEECEHPHDYQPGDKVYVKGMDKTDEFYGAHPDIIPMVGQVYKIITVDRYDGACILGPQELAFHHLDLMPEAEAKKKGLIGKGRAVQYKEILAPDWIQKPMNSAVLQGGACSIYYILYRPLRGEVSKRPSYTKLSKRANTMLRKAYRVDPAYGWKRMVTLPKEELTFPYNTWESTNHACFASLRQQPKYFHHKDWWNGKPPTWMCYRVDKNKVNGPGKILDWEAQAYLQALMDYGLAPSDICMKQFMKEDTVSFRLKKYGMNHLFGMLNCIRYLHEYPSVPRMTLYFMQNQFPFYISFIMAHKMGGKSHGSHSLLSTYGWGNYEKYPHKIIEEAWKLEKYFLKDSKKETPFVEKRGVDSFAIQSTIAGTKIKQVPAVQTWQELANQKPLYWKAPNK